MKSGLIVMPGTEPKVEWESEGQAATRVSTANPSASSERFANSLIEVVVTDEQVRGFGYCLQ